MTEWAQLVYTSADFSNGSRGGWGVKLASPETFRGSAEVVLTTVDTRLFAGEDVGDFPTAEVLERRHRQLTARHDGTGRLLLHAVGAGADATGRPGNVFVHAARADLTGVTAIELWRSDDWLTPFGPAAVSGSRLPAQIATGSAVTRTGAATFLAEPGRLDLLAVLVERLSAVHRDGGVVVLLVESPDEAAQWIAALTFVRDARSDHALGWTTWSRSESLTAMREARIDVVGVDRGEESAVLAWVASSPDASVAIDTRVAVHRDGDVWKRADGTEAAVFGPASSVLTSVRGAVDAFGAEVLGDLLDDAQALALQSSSDFVDPLWAFTAVGLTDPDVELDSTDRGLQTWSLIDRGPRALRPPLVDTAVDDWWRKAPDSAVEVLLGLETLSDRDLLVGRRVVLLLAGELTWSDDIDCRLRLDHPESIDHALANARERVDGLLSHRTRLEEAATILRVFEGYGLAATPEERDVLRARLVDGVDGSERAELLDRTWPPMEPESSAPGPEPIVEPVVEPIVEPAIQEQLSSEDWLTAHELAAVERATDTSGRHETADDVSMPGLVNSWPAAPPVVPAPAPSEEARPADLLERHGPADGDAAAARLVHRWVACMVRRISLDMHDAESLREAVDTRRIGPADVARVLVREDRQTVLDVLKTAVETAAGSKALTSRAPFGVMVSRGNLTEGFAYELAVSTFRLALASVDAAWWASSVTKTRKPILLKQAWSKAGGSQ